jgi:hypothetical protein
MERLRLSPRTAAAVGVIAMVVGWLDPLEGAIVIAAGSGLVTLGAFLQHSARLRIARWTFGMVLTGIAFILVLSVLGGTGGSSGLSNWWLLPACLYPLGALVGLVNGFGLLRETRRPPSGSIAAFPGGHEGPGE